MILSNNHYFLTSSTDINHIVQPLTEFFGVTSFVYQKNLFDGSEIRLSNQPDWIQFFYQKQLYKRSVFEQAPQQYEKNRYIWSALPQHQSILTKAKAFDIDHGMTFVEPQGDSCDFFFIGTQREHPEVLSRMLSHIDLLENFLSYFKQQAASIIKKAKQESIIVADKYALNTLPTFEQSKLNRDAFVSILKNNDRKLFSPREKQCIELLLSGYNFKMIAKELSLSYRTIETHFEHIKQKTGCRTKSELVQSAFAQSIGRQLLR